MSGLSIKVAALVCITYILAVQGNKFLEETYRQDTINVEKNLNSYSGYSRSDNFRHTLKNDFEVEQRFKPQYHLSHFRKIFSNWFWTLPNPRPVEHPNPPVRPNNPNDLDGSMWPSRSRGDKRKMCKNIKGLPKPESGCCGVEAKYRPRHKNNPHKPLRAGKLWPEFENERFRRSTENKPTKMIKGGNATALYQLPWMVHLILNPEVTGLKSCGGTIISSRYVITAAHCFDEVKDLSRLQVILAEYDIYSYPRDCIMRYGKKECFKNIAMKVDHVILHDDYNNTHLQNDVALIRLSSNIPYTDFIRPICMPTEDIEHMQDEVIIIAGWGSTGKTESNLKQAAFVKYVANDKCKERHPFKDDSMFCSIGKHGEDICDGDSGGPLMVLSNNKYFLSGIANGKLEGSDSSLFNNVFHHKNWIIKHVQ